MAWMLTITFDQNTTFMNVYTKDINTKAVKKSMGDNQSY